MDVPPAELGEACAYCHARPGPGSGRRSAATPTGTHWHDPDCPALAEQWDDVEAGAERGAVSARDAWALHTVQAVRDLLRNGGPPPDPATAALADVIDHHLEGLGQHSCLLADAIPGVLARHFPVPAPPPDPDAG
ncbi:hypothetical protein [Yinghuangia soli]|uniref:Uncharacterized protein n=1 Tax=Yinghuangia soli TaxID=2908204 RepID=A0AA41PZK3_9ACTN|nr:hypothetical protein [Yinghuangia soli]MCF2528790.1 hypothetical protein [Yinghuangia soli]